MNDWQSDPRWETSRIVSGASKNRWILIGLGLVVTLLALPATLAIPEELDKNNWPILSVLLFDALSLSLFIYAGREWVAWRRYGEISANLDPWPGQIGGAVAGYFELSEPLPEEHSIELSLQCSRYYRGGKNSNTKPIWVRHLPLQPIGRHERMIWFHFEPPTELPESSQDGRTQHHWKLQLTISQPGPNLLRVYDIPVMNGTQNNHSAKNKMRVREDAAALAVERSLNLFHRSDGGVSMALGPWRHWKAAIFLGIFGAACLLSSIFIVSKAGVIGTLLSSVFGLVGLPFIAGAIWALGCKRVVLLNQERAATRLLWFFLPIYSRKMLKQDMHKFAWKNTSSSTSGSRTTMYYKLYLQSKTGKKMVLCTGLEGESQAEAAAELLAPHCGLANLTG